MSFSIVMYHYVRPIKGSQYPRIKGLEVSDFEEQLLYFKKHYHCLTTDEIIEAINFHKSLPKHSIYLTFDDGYKDHYQFVLPLLKKHKIHGAFFPPVQSAKNEFVLDVNLIHYILAGTDNHLALMNRLISKLEREIKNGHQFSIESLKSQYLKADRFDIAEVIFIKRVLQKGIEKDLRRKICVELMNETLELSEEDLAKKLYMSPSELSEMISHGMEVGHHGYSHSWFSSFASEKEIRYEIRSGLEFLESIGARTRDWVMCYPYGDYDHRVLKLLRQESCSFGITTEERNVSLIDLREKYLLPRLDTNDFPKNSDSPVNSWYNS